MGVISIVKTLTREQKHELASYGIPAQRLSDWKAGRRSPTPAQVVTLAAVTGAELAELMLDAMTPRAKMDATPEQLDLFEMTRLDDAEDES